MGQGQDDGQQDDIDLDLDDTGTGDDGDTGDDSSAGGGAGDGDTGSQGDAGAGGQGQQQRPPAPRPAPPKTTPPAGGDWKPPTREEWDAQTRAARLAAREAKERKEELRRLKLESASEQERREAELADRTKAETEGAWRPRVINAEARAALAAAGCQDVTRLVKLIDGGQVTVEEDGTVTGLDEQVQGLARDYPESFRVKRQPPAGGAAPKPGDDGVVQPGPGRAPAKRMSASERQAAALTGRRPG